VRTDEKRGGEVARLRARHDGHRAEGHLRGRAKVETGARARHTTGELRGLVRSGAQRLSAGIGANVHTLATRLAPRGIGPEKPQTSAAIAIKAGIISF
jgi:hypothetical protein